MNEKYDLTEMRREIIEYAFFNSLNINAAITELADEAIEGLEVMLMGVAE